MHKLIAYALAAVAALAFASSAGATIIDLNSVDNTVQNSSQISEKAIMRNLGPGTYNVTFTEGAYTAFTRWNSVTGCDENGTQCRQGWENSAIISIGLGDGSDVFFLGDADALGGYGPKADGAYYETPSLSFDHSAIYSQQFTLAEWQDVYFYLGDNQLGDNHGGVSLLVTAVPEPASWLLLSIGGFGMIGLLLARQRRMGIPAAS